MYNKFLIIRENCGTLYKILVIYGGELWWVLWCLYGIDDPS